MRIHTHLKHIVVVGLVKGSQRLFTLLQTYFALGARVRIRILRMRVHHGHANAGHIHIKTSTLVLHAFEIVGQLCFFIIENLEQLAVRRLSQST